MTTPSPADGLRECPFCGGEPRAVYGLLSEVHYVTCDNDGCKTNGPSADSEADAIDAWNRRTDSPALLAALRLREAAIPEGWDIKVVGENTISVTKDGDVSVVVRESDAYSGRIAEYALYGLAQDLLMASSDWVEPTADDLARVLEEGE